jgi:glycosyltransferase involved in cell wall biosynthesis
VTTLRILVVATKSPWPPVDGGRLVLLNTIEALAAAGHRIDLVAPCPGGADAAAAALAACCTPHLVETSPRSGAAAVVSGLLHGTPATVARHTAPAVRKVVDGILTENRIDVIHAEQLHTLPQVRDAARHGIPIVHRAHNVENHLWAYSKRHRGAIASSLFAFETRRMSAYEVHALETSACTVALTEPDRRSLSGLVPEAAVHTVPAPFAAELSAGDGGLDGDPAVVTLASASWAPSRDAVAHLAGEIWPTVRRRVPGAVLHVFGGGADLAGLDGVAPHPPPADSRAAFPDGAVVVIPERHPTGVPMKALEAWARGLPLLVDEPTAEILDAADGEELLVAGDAHGYADALARLTDDPSLGPRLVDGGRRALAQRHDPARIAEHLVRIYRWAMTR